MAKQSSGDGKRRFFSAEFKLEAVRRIQERRVSGVSLSQIGRELGVPPDMLRAWARQAEERADTPARDVFPGQGRLPTEQEELRRLQREHARLQQENGFLKRSSGVRREGVASRGPCHAGHPAVRDKYAVIARHRECYSIRLLCRALAGRVWAA